MIASRLGLCQLLSEKFFSDNARNISILSNNQPLTSVTLTKFRFANQWDRKREYDNVI